jgi:hydrogenase expression/formation protein HypD
VRFVDEWRDPVLVKALAARIATSARRPWTIMEVCGGQTHTIARYAIEDLLPPSVTLVHGPGCPVCVTPIEVIDHAIALACTPGVVLCTYGDMLRVPGSRGDLMSARSQGGEVRVMLSPLEAVRAAASDPSRHHVFFSVGFETTAPAAAAAVELAAAIGLDTFSLLAAHVRVPPVLEALLVDPRTRIDGLLAAGHVCTVMGTAEYPPIADRFAIPIVVTGFEPADLLEGIARTVEQLEGGRHEVEIQYARAVRPEGSPLARASLERVFEIADRRWRGLGVVPAGGLVLRERFARFDASRRFALGDAAAEEPARCRAADVLRGLLRPVDCPEFGKGCTPDRPLGAPMVSSEGACAAYHRHRRAPLPLHRDAGDRSAGS